MPVASSPDWEQVGTEESDIRDTAAISPAGVYAPDRTGRVMADASDPGNIDPQPFNPNYQEQTGVTDWINVKSLGAAGNGITDDTGFFQAANLIAQMPPGRMIYIPAGTYKLTANITFSSGVQWLNMGTVTGGFTLSGGSQQIFGGGGMSNPMTTAGDIIQAGSGGTPERLAIGGTGQVLTAEGGLVSWQNAPSGFANPMTSANDLIYGGTGGTAERLPAEADGQILSLAPAVGGVVWGQGPMTGQGDLIVGQSNGVPTRLGLGGAGEVLTVNPGGTEPFWTTPVSGFSNPMTAPGDMITAGAAGAAQRLPAGANAQVLTMSSGAPAWVNASSGFANPMSAPGDLILGGSGGSAGRLAIGATNGQSLQVVNGAVAWAVMNGIPLAGPSSSQPTVWLQPDGTIVVIPLSTYSISGDDSTWINNAYTQFPQIAGGSSEYGGSYNGPWTVGTIQLLPADYTITAGIVAPLGSGSTVNIIGHGAGTRLFVGSGAVGLKSHVAMGGPQAGHPAQQNMATYRGLRFDGSNGGACGVEVGGGWGRHIDVVCANFNAAGAIGLHVNNAINAVAAEWTEKSRISVDLLQNTIACVIENSSTNPNSDSMEYNDIDLYIIANNSATIQSSGLILQGGAFLHGASLRIRGDFPGNSGPVMTIQGNDGNGSSPANSGIEYQEVYITVESNSTSNNPQTIVFGTSNNYLKNCSGVLSFQGNWVNSNVVSGQLTFGGAIAGDSALQAANSAPAGWPS